MEGKHVLILLITHESMDLVSFPVYQYTGNMPRVSKFYLRKNEKDMILNHLFFLISSLRQSKEIEQFIESFLTKEEQIMLAKRLVLFMMLVRGYSHSEIKNVLHLSHETVRQHAMQFSSKNTTFQNTIKRLLRRDDVEQFWQRINKMLKPIDLFLRSKHDMKARAKVLSGDYD